MPSVLASAWESVKPNRAHHVAGSLKLTSALLSATNLFLSVLEIGALALESGGKSSSSSLARWIADEPGLGGLGTNPGSFTGLARGATAVLEAAGACAGCFGTAGSRGGSGILAWTAARVCWTWAACDGR